MTWCVLFDACVQVLNSPTNIPTSALSAFKVVVVVVVVKVYLTSHHKQAISPPLIHVDDRRNEREGGGGQKYGERKGRNK